MAFILCAVVLLFLGLDKLAEFALKKTYLAHVYTEDFSMAKRDFTQPRTHYDYELRPGVSIVHNQSKGNRFEYANNAGFRDPRPISVEKPADEFRIFLTGGSTAFGLGASGEAAPLTDFYGIEYRETISYVLERILNVTAPIPGKTIKVYNTAVWGHAYQHHLFRYVSKLRRYKPDIVVSLDGVNEIHPMAAPDDDWDYFKQGQYNGVLREILDYNGPGLASYLTLWLKNNTYLMTLIWQGADFFQGLEAARWAHKGALAMEESQQQAPKHSREQRKRMITDNAFTIVRIVENYHSVLENDGVPHIIALQPLLYLSKKPRHAIEQKVEALNENRGYYDVQSDHVYKYLVERILERAQEKRFFVADFSEYFDDTSEWVFTDWCHLTAGANYLIAKELANFIKEHFLKQPLSGWDQIDEKNSFFWHPVSTAEVVYAPPAETAETKPQNMLTPYPAMAEYASRELAPTDKLEVVLDLKHKFTLNRARLVWGDESSVPNEWVIETSLDGETWTPWARGDKTQTDNFSWWPGFEYYTTNSAQARYVKYKPLNTETSRIRLRALSVSR
ncbi:MAG: discoidin domain-containing protein [Desulfomonile sp.]|nr:discoidin domain-containing protein [Desulfomonile sp.]